MSMDTEIQNWASNKAPVFIIEDDDDKVKLAKAKKLGLVKQLAAGIYTCDISTSIENLVYKNIWKLISLAYGTSIVSRRSALFGGMIVDNTVDITVFSKKKSMKLGRFTIQTLNGPNPLNGDNFFAENIFISSIPRTLVELAVYLADNQKLTIPKKALIESEVHDWLNKNYDADKKSKIQDLNFKAHILLTENFSIYTKNIRTTEKILNNLLDFEPSVKRKKLTEDDLKFY